MKKTNHGFTLVEIMIVVAIIGIIIAIAVPGFLRARETARARSCQSNLIKIEGAVEQWAMETNQASNALGNWTWAILAPTSGEGFFRSELFCPSMGSAATGPASYPPPTGWTQGDDLVTCVFTGALSDPSLAHTLSAARGETSDANGGDGGGDGGGDDD